MIINNVLFNCELMDILLELQTQLTVNNIKLLQKFKDGPDNIQVQCPYHKNGQERRPSAGIRKSDGLFHCMACGETHSLQEVVSFCFGHYDDLIGSWGWNWLLKNFATIDVEERKDVYLDFKRHSRINMFSNHAISGYSVGYNDSSIQLEDDSAREEEQKRRFVSEEELDSYRYTHPYMYKRGLTDEIIELFDIGFDFASDCITFPVRDKSGRCLFVARRSVRTKYFSYPKGVEKPLYGLYEMSYAYNFDLGNYPDEVIICESMLDALSFWTVDKCAVALNGLGNELQFKQLRDLPCRKLILATDSDSAGMQARKRIRQNVKNKIITEYIFPEGRKDANECTKEELLNLEEVF